MIIFFWNMTLFKKYRNCHFLKDEIKKENPKILHRLNKYRKGNKKTKDSAKVGVSFLD